MQVEIRRPYLCFEERSHAGGDDDDSDDELSSCLVAYRDVPCWIGWNVTGYELALSPTNLDRPWLAAVPMTGEHRGCLGTGVSMEFWYLVQILTTRSLGKKYIYTSSK
jgi:hypothetical protein